MRERHVATPYASTNAPTRQATEMGAHESTLQMGTPNRVLCSAEQNEAPDALAVLRRRANAKRAPRTTLSGSCKRALAPEEAPLQGCKKGEASPSPSNWRGEGHYASTGHVVRANWGGLDAHGYD